MKSAARSVLGPLVVLALLPPVAAAQDTSTTAEVTADVPTIIGPVADGTPPPESPKPEPPDTPVISTSVVREGGRNVTLQQVAMPDLPAPPAPPEPPDLSDPQVQAWMAEMREKAKEVHLAFVSATVYDHEKTLVRWWLPGDPPKSFEGWSNVDFNHLCGFGSFEYQGAHYGLLMGIGSMDTEKWRQLLAEHGRTLELPESPELPADRPAYVVTEGDTADEEGLAIMDGLHHLYANEKDRLAAAYEAREKARIEREAYLKANPPQPKDVTLRFWTGKGRSRKVETQTEEGQ